MDYCLLSTQQEELSAQQILNRKPLIRLSRIFTAQANHQCPAGQ